eukprot:gene8786-biopygen7649
MEQFPGIFEMDRMPHGPRCLDSISCRWGNSALRFKCEPSFPGVGEEVLEGTALGITDFDLAPQETMRISPNTWMQMCRKAMQMRHKAVQMAGSKFGLREGGHAITGGVHADYCFLAAGKGVSMLATLFWNPERPLRAWALGTFYGAQADIARREQLDLKPLLDGDSNTAIAFAFAFAFAYPRGMGAGTSSTSSPGCGMCVRDQFDLNSWVRNVCQETSST